MLGILMLLLFKEIKMTKWRQPTELFQILI
jgi:hypothetical protein